MKPLNPANYPTYNVGDKVTIRQWDDMLSQYGSLGEQLGIKTPYVAFGNDMKQFCGRSFKVKRVRPSINDEHWIYVLDGSWFPFPFTEYMFASVLPVPTSTISFDDLIKGVT